MDRRAFLTLLLPAASAAQTSDIPTTLSGILPLARWAPGTVQTLLVIGGKQTKALPETGYGVDESSHSEYYDRLRRETVARLGAAPSGGYVLGPVAAAFGRKVARFGSVAALVPATHKALVLSPGAPQSIPEEWNSRVEFLIHRLDDAALKKLLSEGGLGREDLSKPLQALFDRLFEDSLLLSRGPRERPFLTLEPEQCQKVRLRVSLASTVRALQNDKYVFNLTDRGRAVPPGSTMPNGGLQRANDPVKAATPVPGTTFGHYLLRSAAPHAIPEKLPLAGENRPVSLEGVSTLGELTKRLGAAVGQELVVSPLLAAWSVEWRGAPEVRSNDLLQAILATTNGVFRQVGNRYVLADSIAPLGPRLERLSQWVDRSGTELRARRREFLPLEWGRFEATDPYTVPKTLMERQAAGNPEASLTIPTQELAPSAELQRLLASHLQSAPELSPTHYQVQAVWMSYLIVPEVGVAQWEQVLMFGKKRPARRSSLTLAGACPVLRIGTAKEAQAAVTWAKEQGATGVALEGPPEALAAAIAERTLPVRGVHRLWKALPGDPEALRERTIQGEKTDWLSPTQPNALPLVTRRLQAAALPGLEALLIYDALPPGYRDNGNGTDGLAQLGYTDHNREAFLTEHQLDILDIAPATLPYPLVSYTPWIHNPGGILWRKWRAMRLREVLNRLRPTISCPAWLQGGLAYRREHEQSFGKEIPGWLIRWTPLGETSRPWQLTYINKHLIDAARMAGANPWLRIPVPPGSTRAGLETYLSVVETEAGEGWQGRYIDLLAYSWEDARALVAG